MTSDTAHTEARGHIFEADGLTKEYDDGRVPALRGIKFQITEGEFVSITGPSGCGKSTLLNMLGTLDHLTSGSLKFRGESILELPDPAAYRAREIGFIFQACNLSADVRRNDLQNYSIC